MGKGFWIFLGVTLGLVGLSVFDFKFESYQTEKKNLQSKLFTEDLKANVQKIKVQSSGGLETFTLEKRQDQWWLTSPLIEPAAPTAVEDWLQELSNQSFEREFLPNDKSPLDYSFYGLQDSDRLASIDFELSGTKSMGLKLGTIKNFESKVYLKPYPLSDRVWMASSQLETHFFKKPFDFREKRLFSGAPDFTKVQIKTPTLSLTLVLNQDKLWQAEGANYKLDQNKVRDFLYVLTGQSILKYTDELATKNPGYKLIHLKVTDTQGITTEYFLDQVKADYMVWLSGLKKTVRISQVDFNKFKDLQLGALRDRREPFIFKSNEVEQLKLKQAEQTVEVKKDATSKWVLKAGNPSASQSIDWVVSLMDQLAVLNVEEFSEGVKTKLLNASPKSILTLMDQKGETLLNLDFFEPQEFKIGPMKKKLVAVKSSLLESLVFISEADFNKLELGVKQSPK